MPKKSIRSLKNSRSQKSESPSGNIRELAEQIQNDLKNNAFEQALSGSQKLEQMLHDDTANAAIYLTSLVWQIRAHQGLKAERNIIEQAAEHYAQEAIRLGDAPRAVQAYRIKAQLYIDSGSWTIACEHLENALHQAIEHDLGREALEILMHMSALELKLCHYTEAIDYLSRAMNAIEHATFIPDDIRELRAVGQRQLCELYDTVGDGRQACDALEAAQNANTHDSEELWMQSLILSRFDMRSGDADAACSRLKKVIKDVQKAVESKKARPEQLIMVELEYAQAIWNRGEYKKAIAKLDELQSRTSQLPVMQAIALTRFQWAVETGKPFMDPDEASRTFSEISNQADNTDVQILLAAALTQASLEIERGHYEPTFESLLHIAQTAAFTQLIPFATRALILRGQIHFAQQNYSQAAIDGKDACESFVIHVDDVSARLSAALMLRAQIELSMANGDETPDEAEKAAIEQLKSDLDRYESHHHEGAFLDLGLALAKLAAKLQDRTWEQELLNKLEPHIIPEFMAHRTMTFNQLKADLHQDEHARKATAEIAQLNGFYYNLSRNDEFEYLS
ncbi:MAG: hypothetical protein IJM59_07610 [Proteobacteria bacterium]|nr:hypothetical protein [Pseudomonadota bacterium]